MKIPLSYLVPVTTKEHCPPQAYKCTRVVPVTDVVVTDVFVTDIVATAIAVTTIVVTATHSSSFYIVYFDIGFVHEF
jgi:hypothetical protein